MMIHNSCVLLIWCVFYIGIYRIAAPARILTGFGGNCISAELDHLLSELLISRQDDPASWWKMNMHRFPQLSPPAQKFLAPPPPTSVLSERLFSTAGDIISDHRCRGKCRDIDLLEVQQPPLGYVTFQVVI